MEDFQVYGYTDAFQGDYGELVYLRARQYSPAIGRFLTRDTWKGNANQPISYNAWLYGYANPISLTDPAGTNPLDPIKDWLLEQLRANTEKCYNEGDANCVWRNYKIIANGGYVYSSHASIHMNNFLDQGGSIEYKTAFFGSSSSKWVMESDIVKQSLPKVKKDLLRKIWAEGKKGNLTSGSSKPRTETYALNYDPDNLDVYYGLGQFFFWAEADYSITDCSIVEVKPVYHFEDTYDWHNGLKAGGNVPGVSDFEDAWSKMLVDQNMAKEFEISGTWTGPNKKYTFPIDWLKLPRSSAADFISEEYLSWIDPIYDVFKK